MLALLQSSEGAAQVPGLQNQQACGSTKVTAGKSMGREGFGTWRLHMRARWRRHAYTCIPDM